MLKLNVNNETSRHPPPKSKTRRCRSTQYLPSNYLSSINDVIAALGSLTILRTFKPAIVPASFVAYF